jgi:hypothetical protein
MDTKCDCLGSKQKVVKVETVHPKLFIVHLKCGHARYWIKNFERKISVCRGVSPEELAMTRKGKQ